jgi:hypothetical protein
MTESLKSHFLNLYAMALTDSQFDEKEIYLLYKISEEKGVPKGEIDNLLLNPATLRFHFPENVEERIEYLYDYAKMILADGRVDDNEMKMLEKFCLRMGFSQENNASIMEFLISAARNQVPNTELIQFVTQNAI